MCVCVPLVHAHPLQAPPGLRLPCAEAVSNEPEGRVAAGASMLERIFFGPTGSGWAARHASLLRGGSLPSAMRMGYRQAGAGSRMAVSVMCLHHMFVGLSRACITCL